MADDLERELRDLAAHLDVPPAPRVTGAVMARLARERRPRRRPWRLWIAILVAVIAAALTPVAAQAVGHLLEFAGIRVQPSPSAPPQPSPSPLPSATDGTLAEVKDRVNFPVRTPATLGPPEKATLADPDRDGRYRVLTLAYRGGTVRFDSFDGQIDPVFMKMSSDGEWTQVGSDFAMWFPVPHAITYIDRTGVSRDETARLSGPTLVWQHEGVTYRLEGIADREQAITVAQSLR
jgi:hypothetical protein